MFDTKGGIFTLHFAVQNKRKNILFSIVALVLLTACGDAAHSSGSPEEHPAAYVAQAETGAAKDTVEDDTAAAGETFGEDAALSGNDPSAGAAAGGGNAADVSGNDLSGSGDHAADVSGNDPSGFAHSAWITDHEKVKGIYVTGPMAGSSGMEDLISLIDETELNAVVIDIKDDNGNITFLSDRASVASTGASVNYIRDIDALMQTLKDHQIYTIARIVCFKDPTLAAAREDLALKTASGTPVTDGNGLAWVNPCSEDVWAYLTDVALMCKDLGFDEVQFDYVRFPVGKDASAADYGVEISGDTRHTYIEGFLNYAAEKLHEADMPVTADVFGTIIGSAVDVASVGQDYAALGGILDAICPMIYPSHYAPGVFGLDVPDAHPYETIYAALTGSKEELADIPAENCAIVRPWLQAFTAGWVTGHIKYDDAAIRAQINAVTDAGYEEWILWNAANRYHF